MTIFPIPNGTKKGGIFITNLPPVYSINNILIKVETLTETFASIRKHNKKKNIIRYVNLLNKIT